MRNLIYVNMMRLKKNRIFRAGVAVSMAKYPGIRPKHQDSAEHTESKLHWVCQVPAKHRSSHNGCDKAA